MCLSRYYSTNWMVIYYVIQLGKPMCRYAMYGPYKNHFACFRCRKAFKQTSEYDWNNPHLDYKNHVFKCPDCKIEMADMGMDFRAPKKSNVKAWKRLETAYKIGHAFQTCGCNGPGFIPTDQTEYRDYLRNRLQQYQSRLDATAQTSSTDTEKKKQDCDHWTKLIDLVKHALAPMQKNAG